MHDDPEFRRPCLARARDDADGISLAPATSVCRPLCLHHTLVCPATQRVKASRAAVQEPAARGDDVPAAMLGGGGR